MNRTLDVASTPNCEFSTSDLAPPDFQLGFSGNARGRRSGRRRTRSWDLAVGGFAVGKLGCNDDGGDALESLVGEPERRSTCVRAWA